MLGSKAKVKQLCFDTYHLKEGDLLKKGISITPRESVWNYFTYSIAGAVDIPKITKALTQFLRFS